MKNLIHNIFGKILVVLMAFVTSEFCLTLKSKLLIVVKVLFVTMKIDSVHLSTLKE